MSGFKRYQSKVFWNQMEAIDLGAKLCINNNSNKDETLLNLSAEDNRDSVPESDTTDPENVTVIHIDVKDLPSNNR